MKKMITVMMIFVMTAVMTGCMYMEDHFTLNSDGSGSVYSYVLLEKETYDSMMGAEDVLIEDALEDDTMSEEMEEYPVIVVDGTEYYKMEDTQEFADAEELQAILEEEYEDVRVTKDTISFFLGLADAEDSGMTYEDMKEAYAEMGVDLDTSIEGYIIFNMPAPIVSTTGVLSEDGQTATYYMDMKTMYNGVDVFVTTSAKEAANEKIRNGVENTRITAKSALTSSGKIKVTWKKTPGYKMDYYEVFRSTKKTSGYGTKAFFKTSSGTRTSYINTSVKAGIRYYYKIRGVRMVDEEKICTQFSNKAYRIAR